MLILSTKLKNAIIKEATKKGLSFEIQLKNTSINGIRRGCSGFIFVPDGPCVYVDTEISCYQPLRDKTLVRYAKDNHDYSSNQIKNGYNQFVPSDPVVIAQKIVNMLQGEQRNQIV